MPLTRDFKKLVRRHVAEDPAFGEALLREDVDAMLTGDVETGKAMQLHQNDDRLRQASTRQQPKTEPLSHKTDRPEDRPKIGR